MTGTERKLTGETTKVLHQFARAQKMADYVIYTLGGTYEGVSSLVGRSPEIADAFWSDLARASGITRPSETTCELAKALIKDREQECNKFNGLPVNKQKKSSKKSR